MVPESNPQVPSQDPTPDDKKHKDRASSIEDLAQQLFIQDTHEVAQPTEKQWQEAIERAKDGMLYGVLSSRISMTDPKYVSPSAEMMAQCTNWIESRGGRLESSYGKDFGAVFYCHTLFYAPPAEMKLIFPTIEELREFSPDLSLCRTTPEEDKSTTYILSFWILGQAPYLPGLVDGLIAKYDGKTVTVSAERHGDYFVGDMKIDLKECSSREIILEMLANLAEEHNYHMAILPMR